MLPYLNLVKIINDCGINVNTIPVTNKCPFCKEDGFNIIIFGTTAYSYCNNCKYSDDILGFYAKIHDIPISKVFDSIKGYLYTPIPHRLQTAYLEGRTTRMSYLEAYKLSCENNYNYATIINTITTKHDLVGIDDAGFISTHKAKEINNNLLLYKDKAALIFPLELIPYYVTGFLLLTHDNWHIKLVPGNPAPECYNIRAAYNDNKRIFVINNPVMALKLVYQNKHEGANNSYIIGVLNTLMSLWLYTPVSELVICTDKVDAGILNIIVTATRYSKTVKISIDSLCGNTPPITPPQSGNVAEYLNKLLIRAEPAESFISNAMLQGGYDAYINQLSKLDDTGHYLKHMLASNHTSSAVKAVLSSYAITPSYKTIQYGTDMIQDRSDGWYLMGKQPVCISTIKLIIYSIDKLETGYVLAGKLLTKDKAIEFNNAIISNLKEAYNWVIDTALENNMGYPVILPKWRNELLNIAVLFSKLNLPS